jgi:hypothetical protein
MPKSLEVRRARSRSRSVRNELLVDVLRRSDFEGSQSACHFVRRTSGFLSHRFDRSVCRLLGVCPTFALGAKFLEF